MSKGIVFTSVSLQFWPRVRIIHIFVGTIVTVKITGQIRVVLFRRCTSAKWFDRQSDLIVNRLVSFNSN